MRLGLEGIYPLLLVKNGFFMATFHQRRAHRPVAQGNDGPLIHRQPKLDQSHQTWHARHAC
jgi:hypothetical protein